KNKNKKKKKVTAGKIIAVIVVLLVLVVGGTGWYGYNFVKSGIQPLDSKNATAKTKRTTITAMIFPAVTFFFFLFLFL
ncbi:hypothetical protein ACI3PF_21760, partial [Lactococcus lactis]